jgi:hypothetical protein
MNLIKTVFLSFFTISVLIACEKEPQNYDDCILKYLKEDMNETATRAIIYSCKEKFSQPTNESVVLQARELTEVELDNLEGRAKLSHSNTFGGEIYNGNEKIRVTELKVKIRTKLDGEIVTKVYSDNITISPQTTKNFYVDIITGDDGAEYIWGIASARGIEINN